MRIITEHDYQSICGCCGSAVTGSKYKDSTLNNQGKIGWSDVYGIHIRLFDVDVDVTQFNGAAVENDLKNYIFTQHKVVTRNGTINVMNYTGNKNGIR